MVASLREKLREINLLRSQVTDNTVNPKWLDFRKPKRKKIDYENRVYDRSQWQNTPVNKPHPINRLIDNPVSADEMWATGWLMDHSRDANGVLSAALPLGYPLRERG